MCDPKLNKYLSEASLKYSLVALRMIGSANSGWKSLMHDGKGGL